MRKRIKERDIEIKDKEERYWEKRIKKREIEKKNKEERYWEKKIIEVK